MLRRHTFSRTLLTLTIYSIISSIGYAESSDSTERSITPSSQSPKSTDKTAAKIIALNLKARGGLEAMNKIKTMRMVYLRKEAQDDYQETYSIEKPFKVIHETYRNYLGWDHRSVEVFNGKEAWHQDLVPEKRAPTSLNGIDRSLLIFKGELFGPFYYHKKKGHIFTYRGKATVGDKDTYLIRGSLRYGMEVDFFIDTKTFHVIKYRMPDKFAGKEMSVERFPLGLRKVSGVWIETGFDFQVNNKSYRRVNLKEIIPNAEILESEFVKKTKEEVWLRQN